MSYVLVRDSKVVQHVVFDGDLTKNWKRSHEIVDLEFKTLKAANEVATVLKADVQELVVDSLDKAA